MENSCGGASGSHSVPIEICVKSRLGLWTKCTAKGRRSNRQNSASVWKRPLKKYWEICSQGTFLFPLMGIWGTTSEAISCVCGALEDSRTVIGLITLEIKAALGFGTIPGSMARGWDKVSRYMNGLSAHYRSSFSQPPLWLKTKISLEAARLMVDVAQNQFQIFL